ncbi:minor coat protein [Synechococcus phage S-SSM4]|jgi:hypothetical protein|uniref:Uncharacterized protein n=1 Tax=Synechococcus phage S-SSM4 TaxID=536466 RepID=M1U2C7_9CAUD|nr:minor coat protein [Synechococcus phage S-SSM4]AGG54073.1 hypothetical protein CYXG_00009 [Synechococcus phage S-SSM4]AGG54350.1 hypothetical protein CYWG_00066 [Cyanophage S-SSM6b]|tara:strand:+ start:7487 stop:8071 length:585 start_codon:yes stop_codon:yes gene_type:complete
MYIIDDFFDNPDEIRSLALKQEYGKWGHDNYPGYRSKMIPLIDLNLWETLQSKLMSIPICRKMGVNSMKAEFAYVPENFGQGWPHIDDDATLAGAIYLFPDPPVNSGTTLYERQHVINWKYDRTKFFMDPDTHYEQAMSVNKAIRQDYREVHKIDNIYNRCALWFSNTYHSEQNFFGKTIDDSRLTLLYFLHRT